MRILLSAVILVFSITHVTAQFDEHAARAPEPYSFGQLTFSMGATHLFQSEWAPYQDQFTLMDFNYIWTNIDSDFSMEAGFSFSVDLYSCPTCNPPIRSSHFDAQIDNFRFGVGKWWRREKFSATITGGLIAGFSEYTNYTSTSGSIDQDISFRGHAGIYARSSMDFKVNDKGLRLGPYVECRFSSGSTDKGLHLNVNGFAVGLSLGWRYEDGKPKK